MSPALSYGKINSGLREPPRVTQATRLIVDAVGNIVVVGSTTGFLGGTQSGAHGTTDLVIASFNSAGALNWVNQLGSWVPCIGGESCTDFGQADAFGQGLVQDVTGPFFVAGHTNGMIPGASQLGSHGSKDVLVAQFNAAGTYLSASQLGLTLTNTRGMGIGL